MEKRSGPVRRKNLPARRNKKGGRKVYGDLSNPRTNRTPLEERSTSFRLLLVCNCNIPPYYQPIVLQFRDAGMQIYVKPLLGDSTQAETELMILLRIEPIFNILIFLRNNWRKISSLLRPSLFSLFFLTFNFAFAMNDKSNHKRKNG